MKKIAYLLLLAASLVRAAPNDLLTNQRNSVDSGTITRTVAVPSGSANGLLGFNGATVLPVFYTIGQGLQISGGVLSSTASTQVNADWSAASGAALILNKPALFSGSYADLAGKPSLSVVATSGAYSDLIGPPSIPAAQVPSDWSASTGVARVLNKPTLFSGAYADLTGKPTIPAAQVQSDWNSVSAPSAILNKPTLFSGAYSSLTGVPATFAPSAHTQAFSTITATPTTLSGYGITDGLTSAALTPYATTSALTTGLAGKFNTPAGSAAQYVRGDGVLATLPIAKRIETYTGTTNATGQVTITYPTAFSAIPNVQPPPPALPSQVWTITSSTTTGFTAVLSQRNTVTLLSTEVLLGAVVPVSGSAVQIVVIER